jgi:hypothetical protein
MARDTRISDIFYYFEQHTTIASGRTVGRKIGVVQEILCKKLLMMSEAVQDCIIYEPKIQGRSGATHKVEFFLFQPTVVAQVATGRTCEIGDGFSVTVRKSDVVSQTAQVAFAGHVKKRGTVSAGMTLKVPNTSCVVKFVKVDSAGLRMSVLDMHNPVASIESKRVGAQRFSGSDKLGSGIQTIEKAKQASLVAIDFDLKYNNILLAQNIDKSRRLFKSFVVLGNGVHWTAQDLAILETYVDYTYLAADAAIVRYAEFVRGLAETQKIDFFKYYMGYFKGMTKTAPDAFVVTGDDFRAIRPTDATPFLSAVEGQILPYEIVVS